METVTANARHVKDGVRVHSQVKSQERNFHPVIHAKVLTFLFTILIISYTFIHKRTNGNLIL